MRKNVATMTAALAAFAWLAGAVARPAHAQDARQLYDKNCVPCHGETGKGDGKMGKALKPPPADMSVTAKTASEADLVKIIKEGGKAVGKSPAMPAYGSKLSDDEIKALAQLVKGFAGT